MRLGRFAQPLSIDPLIPIVVHWGVRIHPPLSLKFHVPAGSDPVRYVCLSVLLMFTTASWAETVQELLLRTGISDPTIIQFLNTPGTKILPDSGIEWESKQYYLEQGEVITGGCSFEGHELTSGPESAGAIVAHTVAQNFDTCARLTVEGTPKPAFIEKLRKWFRGDATPQSQDQSVTAEATATMVSDRASYYVKFTDYNNPLVKNYLSKVPTFEQGIHIGTVTARIGYEYPLGSPIYNNCAAQMGQISVISGAISPGFFWQAPSGGSCEIVRRADGIAIAYFSFDQDGNQIANSTYKSMCTSTVTHDTANCVNLPSGDYIAEVGSLAFGSFYTDDSLPPVFDCSSGITINVSSVYVIAHPRSTFTGKASPTTIVGGADTNLAPCRTNVAEYRMLDKTLATPQ